MECNMRLLKAIYLKTLHLIGDFSPHSFFFIRLIVSLFLLKKTSLKREQTDQTVHLRNWRMSKCKLSNLFWISNEHIEVKQCFGSPVWEI